MFDQENPNVSFEERWNDLENNLFDAHYIMDDRKVVMTPTKYVTTKDELNEEYIEFLKQGFEGQMLRYDRPYEQKRTYVLLKRKEFIDEEYELVDIQEGDGNWQGYAKIAVCRLTDGRTFGAGISGTQEANMLLLREKKKYQSVTVKYFALTPDGIPRFPIATKFHKEMFDGLKERIKPRKDLFG